MGDDTRSSSPQAVQPFAITVCTADSETVVTVTGEIDLATAPALQESLCGLVDDGVKRIVLDLGAVSFMDSTGLGALARTHIRISEGGGRIVLQSTPSAVKRVLAFSGLDKVLHQTD